MNYEAEFDHALAEPVKASRGAMPVPECIDAEWVEYRLQDAGRTLLCVPGSVGPKALGAQTYGYVSEAIKGEAATGRIRITPTRNQIATMDQALPWFSIIREQTIRRVVAMRSMVNPRTDKHVYTWSAIGLTMGADPRAIREWHGRGIREIVQALRLAARGFAA